MKIKNISFAVRVVNLYKYLSVEQKEFVWSKQSLRSETSISANVNEAEHAESKADFVHKR
ncbi:MAG: four helix bundle protein [Cytophagaceae bacterium]|nr:four helix bundle protein [Cytophagaceae bacterium]